MTDKELQEMQREIANLKRQVAVLRAQTWQLSMNNVYPSSGPYIGPSGFRTPATGNSYVYIEKSDVDASDYGPLIYMQTGDVTPTDPASPTSSGAWSMWTPSGISCATATGVSTLGGGNVNVTGTVFSASGSFKAGSDYGFTGTRTWSSWPVQMTFHGGLFIY